MLDDNVDETGGLTEWGRISNALAQNCEDTLFHLSAFSKKQEPPGSATTPRSELSEPAGPSSHACQIVCKRNTEHGDRKSFAAHWRSA